MCVGLIVGLKVGDFVVGFKVGLGVVGFAVGFAVVGFVVGFAVGFAVVAAAIKVIVNNNKKQINFSFIGKIYFIKLIFK